jgi:hypothetical protein
MVQSCYRDRHTSQCPLRPPASLRQAPNAQKCLAGVTSKQYDQLNHSQRKQQVCDTQRCLQYKMPPQLCQLSQSINEIEGYKQAPCSSDDIPREQRAVQANQVDRIEVAHGLEARRNNDVATARFLACSKTALNPPRSNSACATTLINPLPSAWRGSLAPASETGRPRRSRK